jgi:ABC-type dipeptide/oligopeptide/nickel transport system ATPase subunit
VTAQLQGQPVVEVAGVSKSFGEVKAVDSLSFEIYRGEFFSLLGPSGCGKTTTLRLLAGFEEPHGDGGEVRLLGETVNKKRPYERRIAMVFQNYALFPHLTVARNVSFGLEQRKTPRAEIGERVGRALEPHLGYVIPQEGCTIWGDSMCIPKSAANKRAAHEWMNYILRPEVGAARSDATGYGTPNAAAAKVMKSPVPYPTEEELKRLEYQVDLGKDTATWDQIWTEIKSV